MKSLRNLWPLTRKMVYDHIKKTTDFNVLHICKSNIDFNRYKDLHPAIVNWGFTEMISA